MPRARPAITSRNKAPAAFTVGDATLAPGTQVKLDLPVARLYTHAWISLPVTVVHGLGAGPAMWLSAAIHGDELGGIEIIRQVLAQIDPRRMGGTVIAAPVVNVFGLLNQSRYLPDRRDLNRSFPGHLGGSLASRLAHLFMTEVVGRCHFGIDLHTASHQRTNHPQVRGDLGDPDTRRLMRAFGAPVLLHAAVRDGSLRAAARAKGIPVLIYEAGEVLRFDPAAIAVGVRGVLQVLVAQGMLAARRGAKAQVAALESESSRWLRARRGGVMRLEVECGDWVRAGATVGVIADAFGDEAVNLQAPMTGMVIGCTNNPLVNLGDAVVHVAAGSKPRPRRRRRVA